MRLCGQQFSRYIYLRMYLESLPRISGPKILNAETIGMATWLSRTSWKLWERIWKEHEAVWGAIPIQWPGLNLRRNYRASGTAIWQGPHRRKSTMTNWLTTFPSGWSAWWHVTHVNKIRPLKHTIPTAIDSKSVAWNDMKSPHDKGNVFLCLNAS